MTTGDKCKFLNGERVESGVIFIVVPPLAETSYLLDPKSPAKGAITYSNKAFKFGFRETESYIVKAGSKYYWPENWMFL